MTPSLCVALLLFTALQLTSVHSQNAENCQVDLVLAVDRSGSINRDPPYGNERNIDRIVDFLNELVEVLPIGSNNVRVGLVTFSNDATEEFAVGELDTVGELQSYFRDTLPGRFQTGRTNTQDALEDARQMLQTVDGMSNRNSIDNIVIILTDGQPSPGLNNNLNSQASALRAVADRVFGIGVTPVVGDSMRDIVSSPYDDNFRSIETFDELSDLASFVTNLICPVADPPVCEAPQDGIAFSAYATGSTQYEEGHTVHFNLTFLNRGQHYDTQNSVFTCPCRGVYTFTHRISGLNFAMATVIMLNGEPVSPLAYAIPAGMLSTDTIVECNGGEQVWVEVVAAAAVGTVPCAAYGVPLVGFTGRLDFRI